MTLDLFEVPRLAAVIANCTTADSSVALTSLQTRPKIAAKEGFLAWLAA